MRCDAMRACEVKRLVFSSTCATCGEPDELPITENAGNHPTNPYGESKLAFELIRRAMEIDEEKKVSVKAAIASRNAS